MPSTQINVVDEIYRQIYTSATIERDASANTFCMVSTPTWEREYLGEWVSEPPIIRNQWQGGYEGVPREDTDAMEIRFSRYATAPTRWIVDVDADNGVITVGDRPASVPEFNEAWIQANVSLRYRDSCWDNGSCDSCSLFRWDAKKKWDDLHGGKTSPNWAAQWVNIALAHAAAVFCLQVIYDGKEHRVVNADAIRAAIGA